MAITQTAPVKTITKVALEPGMKSALAQNGVALTAEHLGGKSLAVTKSGDSLMVTMPDGSQNDKHRANSRRHGGACVPHADLSFL